MSSGNYALEVHVDGHGIADKETHAVPDIKIEPKIKEISHSSCGDEGGSEI